MAYDRMKVDELRNLCSARYISGCEGKKYIKKDILIGYIKNNDLQYVLPKLLKAIKDDNNAAFRRVIKEIIDVDINNGEALLLAIELNRIDMAISLTNYGANPAIRKSLALSRLAEKGFVEEVKIFINIGAKASEVRPYIIENLINQGNNNMLYVLVENGLYPSSDILESSIADKQPKLTKLLLAKGANKVLATRFSARYGNLITIKTVFNLLQVKNLDTAIYSNIALINAAQYGHDDIVKFVLDKGADIHVNNDEPLELAAMFGRDSTVKLLLDRGASPDNLPLALTDKYSFLYTDELAVLKCGRLAMRFTTEQLRILASMSGIRLVDGKPASESSREDLCLIIAEDLAQTKSQRLPQI